MKRVWILVLALMLAAGAAAADLPWPEPMTAGQTALKEYVEAANANLVRLGEPPINSLFECWPAYAGLGITAEDGQEAPDQPGDIQIDVTLNEGGVLYLQIEMTDLERFPLVAAALIQAASHGTMSLEDARALLNDCMGRVADHPEYSFAGTPDYAQGDVPRAYFSYNIDVYGQEDVDSLSMTLVFARPGADGAAVSAPVPGVTEATPPPSNEDGNENWVGYFQPDDGAEHFELFVTPTPEPDSAVYPY